MTKIGDAAPDFELEDQFGRKVRLSALRGHHVMLLFYPLGWPPT